MPSFRRAARLVLIGLLVMTQCMGDPAWARSSGGYSRSTGSSGGASRGSSSYGGSSSGGYSSGGYSGRRPSSTNFGSGSSGGDRAFSRGSSGQALRDYRASQAPRPAPAAPAPDYGRRPSTWDGGGGSYGGGYASPQPRRAPSYGYGSGYGGSGFGGGGIGSTILTTAAMWAMLNSLSSSGNARTFAQSQTDPNYLRWREEANRTAASDPAVADKLAQLDRELAASRAGQTSTTAAAAVVPARSGGGGGVWLILFILVGVFVLLWLRRRRRGTAAASASASAAPVVTGSAASRFRVGMTIPFDPTPFVLAQGVSKITPPEGGGAINVEALGLVAARGGTLNRLYLPGRKAFFQVHLGGDGTPDECRYFSLLDEVAPADPNEWGAWLDPREGMIGAPEFQTKDGKAYGRAWAPGPSQVAPQQATETLRDLRGDTTRSLQLMLYSAATGAPSPAPPSEHVMVQAVDAGGQAWVEIHVGIDVNPASLSLPSGTGTA